MRKTTILGILVLFAVLLIPAASASEYYLDPDNSSVTNYLDTTEVAIWIDATENIRSGKLTLEYDSSCGNITSCTRNTSVFGLGADVINHASENLTITYGRITAGEEPAGKYHIANFTIQGNSATYCTSDLLFVYQTYARNDTAQIPTVTDNGTFTCGVEPGADIVATLIDPQYIFAGLNNSLMANVTNQGVAPSGPFDVCVDVTDALGAPLYSNTVSCGSLAEGASATDGCGHDRLHIGWWTPATVENITITVTVDCDGDVSEGAGESNNVYSENRNTTNNCDVDTMLPDTCYGYRGQNPMGPPDEYNGIGTVIYTYGNSTSKGEISEFVIGPGGDINQKYGTTADIPDGATIKAATLYVYYDWRYTQSGPNPGHDPNPDFNMSFNNGTGPEYLGNADAYYTDMKGWAASQYQYGTMVYDVTDYVTGNGTYLAQRHGYASGAGYDRAISLMIAYDDGSGSTYRIVHGYDRLATLYWRSSYDHYQYYVDRDNATTTATLSDIDPSKIAGAYLFTVAIDTSDGTDEESQMIDDCGWYEGAWSKHLGSYLSFNRTNVPKSCITPAGTDETISFREGWPCSNGFGIVFACLQTEAPATTVEMDDHEMLPSPSGTLTAPIWIRNVDDYGAATITLDYNKSVVHVTNVADGPFSTVLSHNINNLGGTVRISAQNTVGASGDVEFARITFEAVGSNDDTTSLDLSVQMLKDIGYTNLSCQIDPGSITLLENLPPVISNENADPDKIIQTIPSGRARNVSRNTTTLSVTVTDTGSDVKNVTIDLSPIGGNADTSMDNGGSGTTYSVDRTATDGINLVHNLVVTARDNNDNTATSTIQLEVLRRGDVVRDNDVNMGDALYIARYTVGLELLANNWLLVGDVVGAGGDNLGDDSVDMGDALFISRYTVGLEDEP